jgi:hypothetical protein
MAAERFGVADLYHRALESEMPREPSQPRFPPTPPAREGRRPRTRQLRAADGPRGQQGTEPILKLADPLAQGRLRVM